MTVRAPASVGFVCPTCRTLIESDSGAYRCGTCHHRYPVVCGIPDFRILPDPWLGIADDRAKAERLDKALGSAGTFEEAVRAYWALTPSTPAGEAGRFIRHVLGAETRSTEWLATLPATREPGFWLDLGCGTGDLLAAAGRTGQPMVGVDIALRWLVVARRRPGLADAPLVCAAAQHLPFPDGAFSRVAALGLIEHCPAPDLVCNEARRVLRTGGTVHLRASNRYSLLAEPHVGVWGVGFVPRRWADRYVRRLSGRRYQHHRPPSPRELRRSLRQAGFGRVTVRPAALLPSERERLGALAAAGPIYQTACRLPGVRHALTWITPQLEAHGVVP